MNINLSEIEPRYIVTGAAAFILLLYHSFPAIVSGGRKLLTYARQVTPVVKEKVSVNTVMLAIIALSLLWPSEKPVTPDTEVVPVVQKDMADECWGNYRIMLADLLDEYSKQNILDADVAEKFTEDRDKAYEAAMKPFSDRIDVAVFTGDLPAMIESIRKGGVK